MHEDDTQTKRGASRAGSARTISGRIGYAHVPPHLEFDDDNDDLSKTRPLLAPGEKRVSSGSSEEV